MNINKLKKLISEEALKQTHKKVLIESSKILPDGFVEDKEQEQQEEEKDTDDEPLTTQMKAILDNPAFVTALKQKLGL